MAQAKSVVEAIRNSESREPKVSMRDLNRPEPSIRINHKPVLLQDLWENMNLAELEIDLSEQNSKWMNELDEAHKKDGQLPKINVFLDDNRSITIDVKSISRYKTTNKKKNKKEVRSNIFDESEEGESPTIRNRVSHPDDSNKSFDDASNKSQGTVENKLKMLIDVREFVENMNSEELKKWYSIFIRSMRFWMTFAV